MYEFSRSMAGSAGTRQPARPPLTYLPAARRSLTHSHTGLPAAARAPRTTPGCTCGQARQQPLGRARTRAAGRGEGCRRSAAH